jgi:hypothetical protein
MVIPLPHARRSGAVNRLNESRGSGVADRSRGRNGRLLRLTVTASVGQHAVELLAGLNVEFGEDFLQVVFHGAGADEQPRTDLGV